VSCRCDCGYTCGGPGRCELFKADVMECINEHFKRDCEHDFSGELVKMDECSMSVVCQKCGMSSMDHDCRFGP
jgi:hypothetical protein